MQGRDALIVHYGDCTAPEKRVIEIALCLADIAISIAIDCGQSIRFFDYDSMIDPTLRNQS